MNVNDMSEGVAQFFNDANALQWKKNRDYHPDNIAYLDILQTAFETNITVEQDLWARFRKQLSALRRFVIEGHVESESPRSRMIDVSVYMGMMSVWVEHRSKIVYDAWNFVSLHRDCESYGGCGCRPPTCTTEGISRQDSCDRCRFVHWLQDYATKLRHATEV